MLFEITRILFCFFSGFLGCTDIVHTYLPFTIMGAVMDMEPWIRYMCMGVSVIICTWGWGKRGKRLTNHWRWKHSLLQIAATLFAMFTLNGLKNDLIWNIFLENFDWFGWFS